MAVSAVFVALMLAEAAASTPPAAKPVFVPDGRPEDKITCRRILETGSLIKGQKVCHTRAEWAKLADLGRRDAEDLSVARNGTSGIITPY